MGASRVKMYCDEIVISDAIIRTVNLEMMQLDFSFRKKLITNKKHAKKKTLAGTIFMSDVKNEISMIPERIR